MYDFKALNFLFIHSILCTLLIIIKKKTMIIRFWNNKVMHVLSFIISEPSTSRRKSKKGEARHIIKDQPPSPAEIQALNDFNEYSRRHSWPYSPSLAFNSTNAASVSNSFPLPPPSSSANNSDLQKLDHKIVHTDGSKYKPCVLCQINKVKTKSGWYVYTYYKCDVCDVPLCKGRGCFYTYHQNILPIKNAPS